MTSIEWLKSLESGRNQVGNKAFFLNNLNELSRDYNFSIPQGFVVPKRSFEFFLESNDLRSRIERKLMDMNHESYEDLEAVSREIQDLILNADFPEELEEEIKSSYEKVGLSGEVRQAGGEAVDLVGSQRESQFVAVRSSVPGGTDICDTHLNVNGKNSVLNSIRKVFASLFSPAALYYYGDTLERGIAVIVQSMIEPEKSVSVYTRNPITNNSTQLVFEGVWGMGNSISSGSVYPDYYLIEKDSGNLAEKNIVEKNWEFKRNSVSGELVKEKVPQDKKYKRVLSNEDLSKSAQLEMQLEENFSVERLDLSLERGKMNVLDMKKKNGKVPNVEGVTEEPFLKGRGASPGTASGSLNLIYDESDQISLQQGDIVVTLNSSRDLIPALNKVSGVIAEEGSISSEFAEVAREFEIPVVIGAKKATDILTPEDIMSIDGLSGQIFEEEEPKKEEGQVKEVKESPEIGMTGSVIGTDLKVLSENFYPNSEGAIVPEEMEKQEVRELAEKYSPLPIWLTQSPERKSSSENFWDSNNSTESLRNVADNVGFVSDFDSLRDLREVKKKGVILEDFASIMQLEDFNDKLDIITLDVSSLVRTSGRDYDHPALQNAIRKLSKISKQGCEGNIILEEADPRVIRFAIKEGIDSITVPPQEIDDVRKLVAKEEKRFILDKLREL